MAAPSPQSQSSAAPTKTPRVLLVGWDAADWQVIHPLLDAGKLPNLQKLVDGGVIGNLASLQPMLSPMLWTSIATGKRAYAHGVTGFIEPLPDNSGVTPVGTNTRRCKALWNILSQQGKSSIVCAWQASHPAEPIRGAMISGRFALPTEGSSPESWPVAPDSVQPPTLAHEIADLRLHPGEVDGPMLQSFLSNPAALDQNDPAVQRRLTTLSERLAEVIGVHAVATELLEKQPWDFAAIYYECIDQVGHDFMPFHPPQLPNVSATDFVTYRGVMNSIYQFHDMMLGRLMELAGPDTHIMVISDHGFESGAGRPLTEVEPAQWHRSQGIFVLKGPGVRVDQRVEGATLLDITPTVLTIFGLPVGDDMEGKVLAAAFEAPPPRQRVPSWEEIAGEDGRLALSTNRSSADAAAEAATLRQLADLGYIEAPSADVQHALDAAEAESLFNLGLAYCEGNKATEAKAVLTKLVSRHPTVPRYQRALAHACFAAGTPEEAAPCLAALEAMEPDAPTTLAMRGQIAWARNDMTASIAAFSAAERVAPNDTATLSYLGRAYLRQRRWADAERVFNRTLALDPDSAEAHYGLSVALPRQGAVEPGLEHALRAVGLRYEFPEAHFQLGALLSRLSMYDRAIQAFKVTLMLRPGFLLAHKYLAGIHARAGRHSEAMQHRLAIDHLTATHTPQPAVD